MIERHARLRKSPYLATSVTCVTAATPLEGTEGNVFRGSHIMDQDSALTMDHDIEQRQIGDALDDILFDMLDIERRFGPVWRELPDVHHESAKNLLHYLALRRRDLRDLQARLATRGLSSLGRAEAQVLPTVDAVRRTVQRLGQASHVTPSLTRPVADFARGHDLLEAHTAALLGPAPTGRNVRIMVTLPGESADDHT